MLQLTVLTALLLITALAAGGLPTAGFLWDMASALGFCGAAVIAFLGWDFQVPAGGRRLRMHRNLAWLAVLLTTAHAAVYLLDDRTVREYLLPAAPVYMLAGGVALLLAVGMTLTSLPGPRRSVYRRHTTFRRWHRLGFLGLLGLTAWHVLDTEFSLHTPVQIIGASLVLGGMPLLAYFARRAGRPLPVTADPPTDQAADLAPLRVFFSMLVLSITYAAVKLSLCGSC